MNNSKESRKLVLIGDLIEDVMVKLDGPLQVGLNNRGRVRRVIGGSAANVARVAVRTTSVRFIGRIGVDRAGDELVAELKETGVEVCVQREGRTGAVIILVDEKGERTMVPDRGSGKDLDLVDQSWLVGSAWLHFTGYGLVTQSSTRALVAAAEYAKTLGAVVSIDLASAHILDELIADGTFYTLIETIDPDFVFANDDELRAIDRMRVSTGRYLLGMHGENPITAETNGNIREIKVELVPGVVDTTGAGDAFVGGFIAARLRDATIEHSVQSGAVAAREAIARLGG